MPAWVAKFDGEAEIARQLREESTERGATGFWRERWRQLDQDDVELRGEWFHRLKERAELGLAVAQEKLVGDGARQFAGEPERGRRRFHPAVDRRLRRRVIKGRVDFDGGEI